MPAVWRREALPWSRAAIPVAAEALADVARWMRMRLGAQD